MTQKKKILIYTSSGGHGHLSATQAIHQYVNEQSAIKTSFVFSEVLGKFEPFNMLSGGKLTGEDVYNMLLRRKYYRLLNTYCFLGSKIFFSLGKKWMRNALKKHIQEINPDLIISVVPFINEMLVTITRDLTIPLIVIPTDLDNSLFITRTPHPPHPSYRYCVALDQPMVLQTIAPYLSSPYLQKTGYPVRTEFLEIYDAAKIKKNYSVPTDIPVILIMLGGVGSCALTTFVEEITRINLKAHIIVCTGSNDQVISTLKKITLPKHLSITIIGYSNEVAKLMAMADLVVTKSGSASVCEALYTNTPMILDATTSILSWERLNHNFVEKHSMGISLKRICDLSTIITDLLNHPEKLKTMKHNIENINKFHPDHDIKKLIDTLIIQ